jgi:transcriptional regulator with XRE-family HTH domain
MRQKIKKNLAAKIRYFRKKNTKLSQEKAALAVGMSYKYWQRLEMTGHDSLPSLEKLYQIAKVVKVKPEELLES